MTNSTKNQNNQTVILIEHAEAVKQYEKKPDIEIWAAFNRGDEKAFNYIYRFHATAMFEFGIQITNDIGVVQDCIQNIFIYLRRKRGELKEVHSIKAYLFKSLQREIIRKLNKIKSNESKNIDSFEDSFQIELSHETKLIQLEIETEKTLLIEDALNKLTTRQRQAILLLYKEGMSYKEIAEVLEFSEVKSARKLIYRALDSIKSIIETKMFGSHK
ncbi:RNA polymerase sigma factor [Belliella kenyensis]|uniref:RNA polymerase sigma factor n=1 Tax=Belliella kenyensis TaxID=1472724 RepID=A0ABV8EP70_9BACT|nr:sigma-70 family RNA polymerase sigma factor [Belliella kenyensis]MCH7401648.1 sigma-70 family RNA polymerase sigma factor [Belliella kenyensis]MDN3603074.1 sigma-70 family RNA polymerase sigma factor [Belliella kenyensis]